MLSLSKLHKRAYIPKIPRREFSNTLHHGGGGGGNDDTWVVLGYMSAFYMLYLTNK